MALPRAVTDIALQDEQPMRTILRPNVLMLALLIVAIIVALTS